MIPVHLFGRCADMERISAAAQAADVPVVEDAAQAIGAGRGGQRAGAWGAAGCFSFYPSKNLGAAGDGGCITTSDPDLAERLRQLCSHGVDAVGRHVLVGTTSRLDAVQAAVLRVHRVDAGGVGFSGSQGTVPHIGLQRHCSSSVGSLATSYPVATNGQAP